MWHISLQQENAVFRYVGTKRENTDQSILSGLVIFTPGKARHPHPYNTELNGTRNLPN